MGRKAKITVGVNGFEDAVRDMLNDYFNDVEDGIKESITDVAIETVEELKATSPKKSGTYASGWFITPQGKGKAFPSVVVSNKNAGLTQLLEHGHPLARKDKNGRKYVYGFSPAKPHIANAERNAIRKLLDRIERVAKGK